MPPHIRCNPLARTHIYLLGGPNMASSSSFRLGGGGSTGLTANQTSLRIREQERVKRLLESKHRIIGVSPARRAMSFCYGYRARRFI